MMSKIHLTTRKEIQECMNKGIVLWTICIDLKERVGLVFPCIIADMQITSGKSICVDKWLPKHNKVLCYIESIYPCDFQHIIASNMCGIRPMTHLFYKRIDAIKALDKWWQIADKEEDK